MRVITIFCVITIIITGCASVEQPERADDHQIVRVDKPVRQCTPPPWFPNLILPPWPADPGVDATDEAKKTFYADMKATAKRREQMAIKYGLDCRVYYHESFDETPE